MRIDILAVGRLKSGPERDLCADYCARATKAGRSAHLGPVAVRELDVKGQVSRTSAAQALTAATPKDAVTVLLDERGEAWPSQRLAEQLGRWRDHGRTAVAFLIGGADGVNEDVRSASDHVLAFGPQTWPHKLIRVMVCEQLYRCVSVLTGSPYHRV